MSNLLPNCLSGRWQTGQGRGTLLVDPVLGTELVRVDAQGLDVPAGYAYAREHGGTALRALTYRERGPPAMPMRPTSCMTWRSSAPSPRSCRAATPPTRSRWRAAAMDRW